MATKTENKKAHIEGILGEKVADEAVASIILFQDVAIATQTSGSIVQKNLIANLPNRCFRGRVMEVSGVTQTQANGQAVFRLTNFLCPTDEKFSAPINVVATPIFAKPFFLTVMHSLIASGADVEITVFSWAANGAPAPNVPFNWRCRVERV